jgi:hypothetical protein
MKINEVDTPKTMKNGGSKPRYASPAIVPLGALAAGSGVCNAGSAPTIACGNGNKATTTCNNGNKVGTGLRGKN